VGGAIPIINAIQSPLIANHIEQMMGIVNGTTNYILTRMAAEGAEYETVLKDAQRLGLAEPDPTADVEGMDAAYKLSILGSLAFHSRIRVEDVYREGITRVNTEDIAFGREMGYVLKLLAIGKDNGDTIEARVHPAFLPADHPLARVDGSLNAVYLYGHSFKDMMLEGRGAWRIHGGGFAGTILAFVPFDLLETYRGVMDGVFGANATTVLAIRPEGVACIR
jgi:homoserine dehydrogenase